MMGPRQVDQAALFYEFSLERHVPATQLLRSIDRFVGLSDVRSRVAPFYSFTGWPSIDPELLVRMLLVGCCYGRPRRSGECPLRANSGRLCRRTFRWNDGKPGERTSNGQEHDFPVVR